MSNTRLIEAYLKTDQGQVRDHNEDFISSWEPLNAEEAEKNGWLYIVADGVGGTDAGEVASQFATERTIEAYLKSEEPNFGQRLRDAMQLANADLRHLVAERAKKRMATTMVAAVIHNRLVYIANVGDSRAYLYRNGEIRQITKDQSLVAKLVEEGVITEAEAEDHPQKNVILSSLGSEKTAKIDLFEHTLEAGDLLLLCTDGLTRHVSDSEICQILQELPPAEATDKLVELANLRGGQDNISVILVRYVAHPQIWADSAVKTTGYRSFNRMALWAYTLFLAMVQTVLIFLAWLWLHG